MEKQIIVKLDFGCLNHTVYVYSDNGTCEQKQATAENLLSVIAMESARYGVKKIKLCGAKQFTAGIKNQLTEKIITCFGKADDFTIELL